MVNLFTLLNDIWHSKIVVLKALKLFKLFICHLHGLHTRCDRSLPKRFRKSLPHLREVFHFFSQTNSLSACCLPQIYKVDSDSSSCSPNWKLSHVIGSVTKRMCNILCKLIPCHSRLSVYKFSPCQSIPRYLCHLRDIGRHVNSLNQGLSSLGPSGWGDERPWKWGWFGISINQLSKVTKHKRKKKCLIWS